MAGFGNRATNDAVAWRARSAQYRRPRATDLKCVDPQRLYFDRLADPGRHRLVADFCVHPCKLDTRHARAQQAIGIGGNRKARSRGVAVQDGLRCIAQTLSRLNSDRAPMLPGGDQKFMCRNDEPERGVHRVELRQFPGVEEPVWQHAFADSSGPGEQNGLSLREPPGGKHEAAHRDESVAPPVGEPGEAGDQRAAFAALHEVRVGGHPKRTRRGTAR